MFLYNKIAFFLSTILLINKCFTQNFKPSNNFNQTSFTENKGQVSDQFYKPRPDVLFAGSLGGMNFHLRNNGISYQLNRIDSWREVKQSLFKYNDEKAIKVPEKTTIYRLDVNWLNCNKNSAIKKEKILPGYGNYYLAVCPNGVNEVKSYEEVIYRNIYSGIDLKWYQKNGNLKYDYLVAAGVDYKQIQMEIRGADKISLNTKGELIIETPLGNIIEEAPIVKQNEKIVKSKWVLNENVLSFEIEKINSLLPFIIDPCIRTWGTYYGGNGSDEIYASCKDLNGNVYVSGATGTGGGTAIATVGSHQSTYGTPGGDAFLTKFNSTGVRLWATYYGGVDNEYGYSVAADALGSIYMAGQTDSDDGTCIATVGSHQPSFSGTGGDGSTDAYLVKFNSAGVRQWGTYYGGSNDEAAYGCAIDASNNVYITGHCEPSNGNIIATAGSHQQSYGSGLSDGFLVKFNSNGQRQWGTYYGSNGTDIANSCAIDANDDIYVLGEGVAAIGSTAIATAGCHLFTPDFSGMGFLVKFNSSGVRQWGTYYGGNGFDFFKSVATDRQDNIYICGETTTSSLNVISSAGSHQQTFGGNRDAFLAKFNSSGVRQWATYYGGPGIDRAWCCTTDILGNVFMVGNSDSNVSISTPDSHQPILAGGECDAFLVKFNSSGVRDWGTYYGGSQIDYGRTTVADDVGNIYLGGFTSTSVSISIATANSHQPTFGGLVVGYDGYLAKFFDCILPTITNITPIANQNICVGNTATLSASGSGTISWFTSPTSTAVLSTGTTFVTSTLSAGTHTFYAEASTCLPSATRAAIEVTVNPLPVLNIVSPSDSLCSGQSTTLNASGAASYTWLPGSSTSNSLIVTPPSTQTYTLIGVDALGCKNTFQFSIDVTPTPTLNATVFFYLCSGAATLNASGAETYSWLPGNITSSVALVSPTTTTEYTLVGANKNCTNSAVSTVSLGVAPPLTISSNTQAGCKGTCFTFSTSSNKFSPFTLFWGDSSATAPLITNHCYSVSGNFTVVAQAIYSTGCSVVSANTLNILIYPSPLPSFNITSPPLYMNEEITFNNTSQGAQLYNWSFGDKSAHLTSVNAAHTFTTAGNYCVKLIATETLHNCSDSTTKCLDILCKSEINIPNVFTPNNDGVNDVFVFKNNCLKSLSCFIYNRWGTLIRKMSGTKSWWDGRTDSGEPVSSGTYFYVLEYADESDNIIKKNGWVSVFN